LSTQCCPGRLRRLQSRCKQARLSIFQAWANGRAPMQPNEQPHPGNPLKEHALLFIRISGYISGTSALLFLASFPFAPHSLEYWFTAAAVGAVNFPLLWRHWCRPNMFLFCAIIFLLTTSNSQAKRAFFPNTASDFLWPLFLQYICLYMFVQFSLVYLFRHRLVRSINRQSAVA
jgi:hypothetical protein